MRLQTFVAIAVATASSFLGAESRAVWEPAPGTTWQWQLTGTLNTSFAVEMYDIHLFDTPQAGIDQLALDGRIVICHFDAGILYDWDPDAGDFPPALLGNTVSGFPGEYWLDVRALSTLVPLMGARMDLAVSKGCDGVSPDSVDGYLASTGFPISSGDQLAYNSALATAAHARGLSVGLVNDRSQAATLEPDFDWALGESCFEFAECNLLVPFVTAGKAVFEVEYAGDPDVYCPLAAALGFSCLTKSVALGDEPPNACPLPEPGALMQLGSGVGLLALLARRRRLR